MVKQSEMEITDSVRLLGRVNCFPDALLSLL